MSCKSEEQIDNSNLILFADILSEAMASPKRMPENLSDEEIDDLDEQMKDADHPEAIKVKGAETDFAEQNQRQEAPNSRY